jgi:hypothetical protein
MIKSRMMRWMEHVAHMREIKIPTKFWMENPEGKRTLGKSRHRWEDNIKMYLTEI